MRRGGRMVAHTASVVGHRHTVELRISRNEFLRDGLMLRRLRVENDDRHILSVVLTNLPDHGHHRGGLFLGAEALVVAADLDHHGVRLAREVVFLIVVEPAVAVLEHLLIVVFFRFSDRFERTHTAAGHDLIVHAKLLRGKIAEGEDRGRAVLGGVGRRGLDHAEAGHIGVADDRKQLALLRGRLHALGLAGQRDALEQIAAVRRLVVLHDADRVHARLDIHKKRGGLFPCAAEGHLLARNAVHQNAVGHIVGLDRGNARRQLDRSLAVGGEFHAVGAAVADNAVLLLFRASEQAVLARVGKGERRSRIAVGIGLRRREEVIDHAAGVLARHRGVFHGSNALVQRIVLQRLLRVCQPLRADQLLRLRLAVGNEQHLRKRSGRELAVGIELAAADARNDALLDAVGDELRSPMGSGNVVKASLRLCQRICLVRAFACNADDFCRLCARQRLLRAERAVREAGDDIFLTHIVHGSLMALRDLSRIGKSRARGNRKRKKRRRDQQQSDHSFHGTFLFSFYEKLLLL